MASLHFMTILTLATAVIVFILPTQLEAYYTQNAGCRHNGTWYADKSLVPTTEKCLNCQCTKKTLVCRLKVCPEMPMPPPRGCVVVQKKNTCCPYLSCARLDAFYKIPATRRIIAYLDHYERESIDRVVNDNMLQRRSDDNEVDLYVCVKNGTVYKSGSAMSSSNLCSYCYCIGGTEKCVKPKCMLPLEGCKPIFVDSTCCPVRYDCSTKQTGKSSQEVRYRKTSNKHYMRMSQRLQRNRGCTVGQQFYAEGQKMKSDKDKPCDICFCIRGQRKCAPKKCAPALRNCIPVVPKGQCCPSSYDCGSQRDYRRSQNSRQFNLFSMLFGNDEDQEPSAASEIAVEYPHDRHPEVVEQALKIKPTSSPNHPTTEKSLFDTLREGLEFIDNNNNQMLKDNIDLVGLQPSPTPIPLSLVEKPSTTTEISFLDLLLGPSEANTGDNSSEESQPENKTVSTTDSGLSWVDLLLAPDEEETSSSASLSDKIDVGETSTVQDLTDFDSTISIDRVDKNKFYDLEESEGVLNAEDQDKDFSTTMEMEDTTEPITADDTTQTLPTTLTETTEGTKSTEPIRTEVSSSTRPTSKDEAQNSKKDSENPVITNPAVTTDQPEVAYKTEPVSLGEETTPSTVEPSKEPDFLSVLLDGLSGILASDKPGKNSTTSTTSITTPHIPTAKPMPFFKPLPTEKPHNRINSKIANLTVKPPMILTKDLVNTTFRPLPQHLSKNPIIPISESLYTTTTSSTKPTKSSNTNKTIASPSTTTSAPTTQLPATTSTTIKPLVIKTNPTILEADPLDTSADHTLPPSLPNLKIIPFLPTDAVKADHSKPPSYDYYHHGAGPTSRIDYDQYDDANIYPSITEKYPLYPDIEDGSKAEYIYKFNVEGPDSLVSSTAGKFDGTLGSPAFVKYDFVAAGRQPPKGFSPPTKTEGGFVPKDPLMLDDDHDNVSVKVGDSYQVTQHIIDITTSGDLLNTTKIIDLTTPDPFKDVIRTELPPDLTSLIEDKLKNLIAKANSSNEQTTNNKTQNSFDMNINDKKSSTTVNFHKAAIDDQHTMMTDIQNGNTKVQEEEEVPLKSMQQRKDDDGDDSIAMETQDNASQNAMTNGENNPVQIEEHHHHHSDEMISVTIPPFKSLPQAVIQHMATESVTSTMATDSPLSMSASTENSLATKNKQSSLKMSTISTTSSKRPIKNNRNKTLTIGTSSIVGHGLRQPQLKLTKNKVATSHGHPNATTTETKTFPSSSTTTKTKVSATRRVTSPKPTRLYKPTFRPKGAVAISTTTTTTKIPTITKTNTTVKGPPSSTAHRITGTNIESTPSKTIKRPGGNRPKTNVQNKKPTMNVPVNHTAATTTTRATTTTTTTTTQMPTTIMQTTSPSTISSSSPVTTSSTSPTSSLPISTTANPFLMSPFDKLPFMDASFEVKRNSTTPLYVTPSQQKFVVATGYENSGSLSLPYSLTQSMHETPSASSSSSISYDPASSGNHVKLVDMHSHPSTLSGDLSSISSQQKHQPQHHSSGVHGHTIEVSTSSSSPPRLQNQHQQQQQQQQQHSMLNTLIDPTGILKLAGCNIYGRMYRVGRIILELSSACQECRCTEIGVKCAPLDC
ncbi:uncharacterized protein LOC142226215 [Haematobia irritans]|uniref:uncharacterized protein LOC142226215 n=1 Tax=Haematobia irritans TaxID=7368 RepID=UPI003F4F81E6